MARRLSRIAFGGVLIVGACALVFAVATHRGHTMQIIVLTWIAALLAGGLARCHRVDHPNHHALGVASLALPIVGLFLIGPLTLHLPVALLVGVSGRGFDVWVLWSVVLVGLAHLAGALCGAVRAVQLSRGTPAWSPGWIFLIIFLASLLPGLCVALPPVLVVLTCLPFLAVLNWMESIAKRERFELAGIAANVPIAIARGR